MTSAPASAPASTPASVLGLAPRQELVERVFDARWDGRAHVRRQPRPVDTLRRRRRLGVEGRCEGDGRVALTFGATPRATGPTLRRCGSSGTCVRRRVRSSHTVCVVRTQAPAWVRAVSGVCELRHATTGRVRGPTKLRGGLTPSSSGHPGAVAHPDLGPARPMMVEPVFDPAEDPVITSAPRGRRIPRRRVQRIAPRVPQAFATRERERPNGARHSAPPTPTFGGRGRLSAQVRCRSHPSTR